MLMLLLDYPRLDHMVKGQLNYGATSFGKNLKKELIKLGLRENVNYTFEYVYPKVPEPDKMSRFGDRVLTYKAPKMDEVKANLPVLMQKVLTNKPDVIIPFSSIGSQLLTGSKITKAQGVPVQGTLKSGADEYTTWVLPMLSQEYVESKPTNKITRDMSMNLLGKYLKEGAKVFTPERPDYQEVTTLDGVKRVFAMPKVTGEFAWDTETNTLFPNRVGAKVLVLSFSWQEGHAVAIPLEHGERYNASGTTMTGAKSIWTPDELEEIYSMFRNLLAASTVGEVKSDIQLDNELPADHPLIKVGHNISFDEHFLMATNHATEFNNVLDTLNGYYLEVRQDTESSRHLSDLAFLFTTIGGYDAPLEEYKKWLLGPLFKSVANYYKGKRAKDKGYQLSSEDTQPMLEALDWSYFDTYHFEDVDRIKSWVINQVAIPVANRYDVTTMTKITKIKATMNLETISTDDHFNDDRMSYEWIPMEVMAYYAAGDSDAALRIHHRLYEMICEDPRNADGKIKKLYTEFYPQLITALSHIQNNGMHVDDAYLTKITKVYADEQQKLDEQIRKFPQVKDIEDQRQELYQLGVTEFAKPVKERDKSIVKYRDKYKDGKWQFSASRKEDKNYLFYHELGYKLPYDKLFITDSAFKAHKPEAKLTYKDYKSGKDSIDEIKKMAEEKGDTATAKLMEAFRKYSVVAKIASSFTDSLREYISDKDGCLHGRYSSSGVETGRLSSSQINMQNIPAHTSNVNLFNYDYPIKRMFNSRFDGGYMLNIDYSSLEFHILALITKEDSMTKAFLEGKDVHKANASLMYGVPYDEVTAVQRKDAKALGFGEIYGKGTAALAEDLGVTEEEAQAKTDAFFASKPNVEKFINDTHKFVEENGYVTTLNGFRRSLTGIISTDFSVKSKAERQSVNTVIQGSGAILTNTSIILIQKAFKKLKMRSVIAATVHDSVLIDAPADEVHTAVKVALGIMTHLPYPWLMTEYKGKTIRYPIEAAADIGDNYNDMVGYDEADSKSMGVQNYIDYQLKLEHLKDNLESKVITEDQYNLIKDKLEALIKH